MRRTTILMLWVGVLNGAGLCAGDLTAEQILARVSETYRNLKSFHLAPKPGEEHSHHHHSG